MRLVRIKIVRWVVGACAILSLASATAPANVCPLKDASVSQIQGQVKLEQEMLDGIPVQLWKSEQQRAAKVSLVAESKVRASGLFSFSRIPSGWYRLTFPLPGIEGDDFYIHVQGRTLFRW